MGYSLFIKKIMSSFQLSSWFLLPVVAGMGLLTSACGVPLAVSAASYAADGVLLATSEKSSTDHIASVVTEKDCAIWRVFRGRRICTQRADGEDPYDTDYTEPQRSVSESGVSYSSPLRPQPDAPAFSWDAAAYEAPPLATPQPAPAARQASMSASVEPVPERAPPPAAVSPAPAKPKKTKTVQRSAKKPSRGPAASAP
jgi:hypothetical protein